MEASAPIASHARELLRRLRDRNLAARRVAVRNGLAVSFGGCTSMDAPAEGGVRYRLGVEALELELELGSIADGGLEISLREPGGRPNGPALRVDLGLDGERRVVSRAMGARIDVESAGERELDHFLRRVVRTAFGRPGLQRVG
jgi:hypothetical protein